MSATVGFDTATERTVVGATVDGEVVFEFAAGLAPGEHPAHSVDLLPAIEKAVEMVGGWDEVDLLGVGTGPGTFTGLRIAIATARGLELSGRARAVGVSTLEAMAESIASRMPGSTAIPLVDAKRGEVFFGAWDTGGTELHPASVGPPSDLTEVVSRLPGSFVLAGPGAVRFRSELLACGLEPAVEEDPINRLEGSAICRLAEQAVESDRQEHLEPIYLRAPDAKRWTESRQAG